MNRSETKIRRTRYLVNRRLQLGFALRLLLILVLFALFIFFEAWITLWPVLSAYVPENKTPVVLQSIAFRIALFGIPVGFVIVAMGVTLSHRVAGPLFRIERTLDALIDGRDAAPIRLRKHDELQGLARRINHIVELRGGWRPPEDNPGDS